MKIEFLNATTSLSPNYSLLKEQAIEQSIPGPNGKKYQLVGIFEKTYHSNQRIRLGALALAKVFFSLGIGLAFKEIREDLSTFWTGKKKIKVYRECPFQQIGSNALLNSQVNKPLTLPNNQSTGLNKKPSPKEGIPNTISDHPDIKNEMPSTFPNNSLKVEDEIPHDLEVEGEIPNIEEEINNVPQVPINDQDIPPTIQQVKNPSVFSLSLEERKLLITQIEEQKLHPLSREAREATGGNGPFYLQWFKNQAGHYHANGDKWEAERLEKFFEEGLMSHYINTRMQQDFGDLVYNYNYSSWLKEKYADCKFEPYDQEQFRKIARGLDLQIADVKDKQPINKPLHYPQIQNENLIRIVQPYAAKLKELKELKSFPLKLRQLGALFQLNKVEVEKLQAQMLAEEGEGQREALMRRMLEKDREVDLMQTLIYHWTNACVEQIIDYIKKTPLNQMSEKKLTFEDPDFLPDFLKK